MKKTIALLLSALLLVSVFAIPSSATTKADLLAELKKSPVYPYIQKGVENSYNTVTISDEQAAQLMPLVQEFLKVVPKSLGPTANNLRGDGKSYYSLEQIDAVYKIIYKACGIMGWNLQIVLKTNESTHKGDYVFYLNDANDRCIFEYDGDLPTDTAGDTVAPAVSTVFDNGANIYLIGGSVVAAASVALYIAFRKKEQECA